MYKYKKATPTTLRVNKSVEGERLEMKIARIVNNNEPIDDVSPLIYTERKDGVQPAYDIRTDRMEVALHGMDIVDKTHKARREERLKAKEEPIAGSEPIQGTDGEPKK